MKNTDQIFGWVVQHTSPPGAPERYTFHPFSEGSSFYKDTAKEITAVYSSLFYRRDIPAENTAEADEAISEMLKVYDYPANPHNAGRAGWRAARLYGKKAAEITEEDLLSVINTHKVELTNQLKLVNEDKLTFVAKLLLKEINLVLSEK